MRNLRLFLLLCTASIVGLPAFAGAPSATVRFVVVDKSHEFNQTGPSTVTEDPNRPFRFHVEIDGENQSGSFPTGPNQITSTPALSGVTGPLSLVAPDSNNDHWRYNSPSYSSASTLNADYGGGIYTLLIGGQTISLNLPVGNAGNGFLFPNTPLITATGATWLPNGTLAYDPSSGPLTLASNLFSTNAGATVHLGINLDSTSGQPFFNDFSAEAFGSGPSSISQTYNNPGEFISGSTYEVSLEFNNIVDGPFPLSGQLSGGQAVAVYTARTTLHLQIIPEPSAYAALAGVSVLVLAAWCRRSRK